MKSSKWSVVPFTESDLPDIALFFKRQFQGGGTYGTLDIFTWKVLKNPVSKGLINLIKDGRTIASTTSVTPKSLLLKGELIQAGEIGDTYTDSSYQRQGMFAQLINRSREDAIAGGLKFIYGTPNGQSLPGYEKHARFSVLKSLDVGALSLPLNVQVRLLKYFPKLISAILGASIEFVMRAYLKIRLNLGSRHAGLYQAESVDGLPADWEEFWQTAKASHDFILNRNRETMEWRYFNSPGQYQLTLVRQLEGGKQGKLVGYIVDRVLVDESANVLALADFLFLTGHEASQTAAIWHVMKRTQTLNLFKVLVWCPRFHSAFATFRSLGFRLTGEVAIIAFRDSLFDVVETCRTPHFTLGDSDNV